MSESAKFSTLSMILFLVCQIILFTLTPLPLLIIFGLVALPLVLLVAGVCLFLSFFAVTRPTRSRLFILKATYIFCTVLSLLMIVFGIYILEAAERSAKHGGGLMGGVGAFPIIGGVLILALSMASIFILRRVKTTNGIAG